MEIPYREVWHQAPPGQVPKNLLWLGHSGVFWKGPPVICIDPFNLDGNLPPADIILITHPHFDHCSPDDVARVCREETVVVAPPDALAKISLGRRVPMAPGERREIAGALITGIAAYNHKRPYHPKDKKWLGFLIESSGTRIYHAGDTDVVAEAEGLRPDVALLPLDGLYNMNMETALAAADQIKPGLAAPIHCGSFAGRLGEAERFVSECRRRGTMADFLQRAFKTHEDTVPQIARRLISV